MDSRPPPPQGPPPSYAFAKRMYRSNMRPVVLFTTGISAFWALASGVGYFRNYGIDRTHNVKQLPLFSIVLGAVYMAIFLIELVGFISACSNRIPMARAFAYLSIVASFLVSGAGILDIVVHFTLKNEIIDVCSQLSDGNVLIYYGFWGPVYKTVLDEDQAKSYCTDSWNHDSWATILSFLITTFLALLFSSVAFAYYHQLLDPTSPINSARAPSYQARTQGYSSYYNPPYNSSYNPTYHGPYDGQSYNEYHAARTAYPGPPPPIPERDEPFVPPDDQKPPSYTGDGLLHGVDDKDDPFDVPERDLATRPSPGPGRDRF